MNSTSQQEFLQVLDSEFVRFEKNLNGHALHESHKARKEAVSFLREQGLPGAKNEEYKYTNIAKKLPGAFAFPAGREVSTKRLQDFVKQRMLPELDAYHISVVNGRYVEALSDVPQTKKLRIESFGPDAGGSDVHIPRRFGALARPETDAFIALNTTFYTSGLSISIASGATIDKPIVLHHLYTDEAEEATYNPRVIYDIGEGAQADIIELYHQLGDRSLFINMVEEVFTGHGTILNCYKVQTLSMQSSMVDNTRIDQKRDGTVNTHTYSFDASMIRNNLNISLSDTHCETHMYGLYALNASTHVDNHTAVDHLMPDSFSNEIYKGILDGASTGVFNGKIFVRPDAQKTNAFQSNKNILLTDKAKVNTKPQLEIWADDVKCSHGCTTGQIDEEQLFYLRSRGIPERQAQTILLHAFAADVLENIRIPALKEMLDEMVTKRLH